MYICRTSFLLEYCEMLGYNSNDPIVTAAIHNEELEKFFGYNKKKD